MNSEERKTVQADLESRFDPTDVYERQGGFGKMLHYIAIDKIYNRMNKIFPLGYSWNIKNIQVIDKSVVVVGSLEIHTPEGEASIVREGIGADKLGSDVDKSTKTAMAEAFKKACHTLGVGLYLWDEDERDRVDREKAKIAAQETATTFTKEHLASMKDLRAKLELKTDAELNKVIEEYPDDDRLKTKADLTPQNIDKFIEWALETKITVTA